MEKLFKVKHILWGVKNGEFIYEKTSYSFSNIDSIHFKLRPSILVDGEAEVIIDGKALPCYFRKKECSDFFETFHYIKEKIKEAHGEKLDFKFSLIGNGGNIIYVYDNYYVIETYSIRYTTLGNAIAGVIEGETRVNYSDLTSVEINELNPTFKYIQFHYPGKNDKINDLLTLENYDNVISYGSSNDAKAKQILNFIREKMTSSKNKNENNINQKSLSVADELKKFKDLLDAGVITKEEFDKKKKELLNL